MYFTLAISAATADSCATLTQRALATDVCFMPVPGPATVAWRSADGRAALLRWGGETHPPPPVSCAGTIWAEEEDSSVRARTSITRVDPVYAAELPGAVILSDRCMWAAAVADRLGDFDPSHACALLNTGFPLGGTTPWRGVSALPSAATA